MAPLATLATFLAKPHLFKNKPVLPKLECSTATCSLRPENESSTTVHAPTKPKPQTSGERPNTPFHSGEGRCFSPQTRRVPLEIGRGSDCTSRHATSCRGGNYTTPEGFTQHNAREIRVSVSPSLGDVSVAAGARPVLSPKTAR
jgi:hypothetical protein